MASDFTSLNEEDTRELRKELGLPITKELKYLHKEGTLWIENVITDYKIVDTYQPSGTHSLMITFDNSKQIRILADYLSDMQKPSFITDIEGEIINSRLAITTSKIGKRIEATPKTYIVVDLETTGTNHYTDEIIEIGAIKYTNGTETARYTSLVKSDKEISKKIEKLTGISNEMLEKEGIDLKSALISFYEFLGNDIVIGHNIASFDSKFIEDAFQKVLNCHFSNDYIDTLYLARKLLPQLENHKLENLSEEYNVDYSKAHRAVEDCIINHFVYEYMAFGKLLDPNVSKEYLLNPTNSKDKPNQDNDAEELVLINDSEISGWKQKLTQALNDLVEKRNLPADSLCIMANIGKKTKAITSYSVCIYEPDLVENSRSVERNSIVTRITEGKLKSNPDVLTIEPKNQNELLKLQLPIDATKYEPEKTLAYVRIDQNSECLIPYLISSVEYAIDNYSPKAASFACCARYEECSNDKKCTHSNQLYSMACEYRKNLEVGKIFYGENKNI